MTVTTVRTEARQGINSGAAFKSPCRVATTDAITLEGLQTVDGVSLVAYDSILVKNQSDATFNGIYWVNSGQWIRRPDFDGYFDAKKGSLVWVNDGTVNALTLWRVSSENVSATQGPLPGTSSINFVQVSLGGGSGGSVASFSAIRVTSDQSSGSVAIFNSTSGSGQFNNEGYSTSTGVFTCPASDYYCFRSQIVTRADAEASFSESFFAIFVGSTATAHGASYPDPSQANEQLPATITLGPIFLASGTQVSVKRVANFSATPTLIEFDATIRVVAHPASRFEGWRFGTA